MNVNRKALVTEADESLRIATVVIFLRGVGMRYPVKVIKDRARRNGKEGRKEVREGEERGGGGIRREGVGGRQERGTCPPWALALGLQRTTGFGFMSSDDFSSP